MLQCVVHPCPQSFLCVSFCPPLLSYFLSHSHIHTLSRVLFLSISHSVAFALSHPIAHSLTHALVCSYEVASIRRLLQIIGLFCRTSSLLKGSFSKETYNCKEPTNRSHPIPLTQSLTLSRTHYFVLTLSLSPSLFVLPFTLSFALSFSLFQSISTCVRACVRACVCA